MTTTTDTATREMLERATRRVGTMVHAVPDDRWDAPTPCTEWSVHDLVNHLTNEWSWAPHMLRGERVEQVGDKYDGDLIGDHAERTWDDAAKKMINAWAKTGDDQVIHASVGDEPAGRYADELLLEATVHGWDLARGAGLDSRFDPDIVEHVLTWVGPVADGIRGPGGLGPAVPTDSPDPQDRLIALCGRQP